MVDPIIAGQRLVTADHVCLAVQQTLEAGLKPWLATKDVRSLSQVRDWLQVPTTDAVQSAVMPVGAITCPGWSSPPVRQGRSLDAWFRVTASVYDRDKDWNAVQAKVRLWAALVAAVLNANRSLGGFADTSTLVDQRYDLIPEENAARTLGGCVNEIDVYVKNILPTGGPITATSPGPVTSTSLSTSVTVRPAS